MEIAIIKRETTGTGPNQFVENETIAKYEIMDGAPVRGESIPIRVFLAGYDLTPTMRDINKKFSVRYYLNLVLMDTEDRRYFKQQEITLWRKGEKSRKPTTLQSPQMPSHLVGHDGQFPHQSQNPDNGSQHRVNPNVPSPDGMPNSSLIRNPDGDITHPPIESMQREEADGQNENADEPEITSKMSDVDLNIEQHHDRAQENLIKGGIVESESPSSFKDGQNTEDPTMNAVRNEGVGTENVS